ncbi:glycosyltransferase [Acidithiobacillus thiooxidans]|uniref:glycosyltransferase n=1 Tax=Acidithiobacillus thiooxidans TaxID=930 RepID=UPI0002625067|nr:glycosyltransferase [Acidithiobacillus thiooxidans]MBU2811478.1 glycosyltransferase [Acidithiobacillus thiooxidans]
MNKISPFYVTVITVTYGDRKSFIDKLIQAVANEKVFKIIIVDNGAEWDVDVHKKKYNQDFINVLKMGKNTGSATGFSAGIEYAINSGSKYLWLLDDDNKPECGSLQQLLTQYIKLCESTPEENLAVLSYRPAQQIILSSGESLKYVNPKKSSFHGFHICDIPHKIRRRIPFIDNHYRKNTPDCVSLDAAPYGGLFINYKLVKKIGLPRKDFILYEDDTEYTYRITQDSGKIFCILSSKIEDMEVAWNAVQRFNNSFTAILKGAGDFKAYYNMRNCTYLDEHVRKDNSIIYFINKNIYISILKFMSIVHKKPERFKLLSDAIKDGKNKVMGIKEGLSLPSHQNKDISYEDSE